MSVIDPTKLVSLAGGALSGALLGFGGAWLGDVLPARYGIAHVASAKARRRRYAAVILVLAVVGAWLADLAELATRTTVLLGLFGVATNLLLATLVVAAAAVDLEHMILPNELTYGAALLAFATAHWRLGLDRALLGAAVGLALTYLPSLLYQKLRGRSGQGIGDVKLVVAAGAWLGAPGAIFVVLAASVQAALLSLVFRILRVEHAVPASVQAEIAELRALAEQGDEDARAALADDPMAADVGEATLLTARLPMGPALVLACLEFLIARQGILGIWDHFLFTP